MNEPRILIPLGFVALCMLAAIALWLGFVRAVPEESGTAIITSKAYQPPRVISRYQGGTPRQDWTPDQISIPETYLLELRLADGQHLNCSVDLQTAKQYSVGQTVAVAYKTRGIPLIWRRNLVIRISLPHS
jgi:hypothetical protein